MWLPDAALSLLIPWAFRLLLPSELCPSPCRCSRVPACSERFVVGGHEWVLLFYPDGKRSSSEMHNIQPQQVPPHNAHLQQQAPGPHMAPPAAMRDAQMGGGAMPPRAPAPGGGANGGNGGNGGAGGGGGPAAPPPRGGPPGGPPAPPPPPQQQQQQQLMVNPAAAQMAAAAAAGAGGPPGAGGNNDYCALFVALIGETDNPQGVVNTSEGRVVRAFHRFTLVDQSGEGAGRWRGQVGAGRWRGQSSRGHGGQGAGAAGCHAPSTPACRLPPCLCGVSPQAPSLPPGPGKEGALQPPPHPTHPTHTFPHTHIRPSTPTHPPHTPNHQPPAGRGQDITKGRRRDQGAVKISCARQDPNARNCHGYRKFVKKSLLEDAQVGARPPVCSLPACGACCPCAWGLLSLRVPPALGGRCPWRCRVLPVGISAPCAVLQRLV
jgi:hypothetical protein